MICIPQESIDKVREIVTRKNSTTLTRQKELEELFGSKEFATDINKRYESSLLLKNQDTALDKFLSNYSEMGQKSKSELRAKIKERLASRTDRIQNEELLSLAQEIWNRKYKVEIPLEDMKRLNQLKIEVDDLKPKIEGTPALSEERMAYGRKVVALKNLIEDIKYPENNMNLKDSIKKGLTDTKNKFSKEDGVAGNIGTGVKTLADFVTEPAVKSFNASMDLSFIGVQGLGVGAYSPKIFAEQLAKALEPLKHIKSKEVMQAYANEWNAALVSHPRFEEAISNGVRLMKKEDFFPSSWAERFPALGNVFKSSDLSFTMFQQGSRLAIFDDLMTKWERSPDFTPAVAKNLAELANSFTGSGGLGRFEANSGALNRLFYSARYISANIDIFTKPFTMETRIGRIEAQKHSARVLGTIATIAGTASLFTDVELDPRSADFCKFRIPGSDKWTGIGTGICSYITLASRIGVTSTNGIINSMGGDSHIPEYKKADGELIELNTGEYGGKTAFDVGIDWVTGKLAPLPSAAVQHAKGRDYDGEKPTITGSALGMVTPMSGSGVLKIMGSDDSTTVNLISSVFTVLGLTVKDKSQYNN